MTYTIRKIEKNDDAAVESVIRACLVEFGAAHEGTAWADPDLCRFSEVYSGEGEEYWVAEDADGVIVGGVGIGCLDKENALCELQKMYCLPRARGHGLGRALIETALGYARKYYGLCYIETLENMTAAQRLYEKYGFVRVYEPIIKTEHFACETRYIKDLKK